MLAYFSMGTDALLYIACLAILGGVALLAGSIIPYFKLTRKLARLETRYDAAVLFLATLSLTLVWWGLPALFIRCAAEQALNAGALIAFAGVFGVALILIGLLSDAPKTALLENAGDIQPERGPFQIWTQDLIIAVLCYGAGLALLHVVFGSYHIRVDGLLGWPLYMFIASASGLFFAADLCRRQTWGQTPTKRAAVFVAVFVVFQLTLPLALLAWWRWRRVLKLQMRYSHDEP